MYTNRVYIVYGSLLGQIRLHLDSLLGPASRIRGTTGHPPPDEIVNRLDWGLPTCSVKQ